MGLRGQAALILLLVVIAHSSLSVTAARNTGRIKRSFLAELQAGVPDVSAVVDTGLQDPKLANGTTPAGHILSGAGLWKSTNYSYPNQLGGFKPSGLGTWGQVYNTTKNFKVQLPAPMTEWTNHKFLTLLFRQVLIQF